MIFGGRKKLIKDEKTDPLAHSRMSFGDHLEELRGRMIKSIYGLLVGFGVCFYFRDEILHQLAQPFLMAMELSNIEPQLMATTLPEAFMMSVRLSLYMGIFVSSPWIIYQLWGFIAAGLYAKEKRYVNIFMPFSVVLFIVGCVFFIQIVAPISFNFFIRWTTNTKTPSVTKNFIYDALLRATGGEPETDPNMPSIPEITGGVYDGQRYVYFPQLNPSTQNAAVVLRYDTRGEFSEPAAWSAFAPDALNSDDPNKPDTWAQLSIKSFIDEHQPDSKPLIKPWYNLDKYVTLVMLLGLAFGIGFQMPLAVFFLGRVGLVQISTLKSVRKYVFFGIVVGAALITPPDVISQVLLGVPMYVLYEFGILMLWLWPRKKYE